jgi:hypothetical protein
MSQRIMNKSEKEIDLAVLTLNDFNEVQNRKQCLESPMRNWISLGIPKHETQAN